MKSIEVYFKQNNKNIIFTTIFATFYFEIAVKWSKSRIFEKFQLDHVIDISDRVEAYFACAAIAPCNLSDISTRACSTTTDMSMELMVEEIRSCAETSDGSPQMKAQRITSSFSIFANLAKRRTSDTII